MGQDTGRNLHVDVIMSQMAIGYFAQSNIAGSIAPVVTVPKQSDRYTIFSRADFLRSEDDKRSPGAEANKITRTISTDTYHADNYALKYPVTIEDRENADPVYRQELINNAGEYVMDKLGLNWEIRVAGICNSTSNVGSSANVASGWDNPAGGDPIGDIHLALDVVQDRTGIRPNRLLFGLQGWRYLRRHDDILNRIFGTNNGGGFPTREQVANLMEVEEIIVGETYQNTAGENLGESLSKIWTDNVIAYYAPPNPSRDRPSWMYSFRWAPGGLPNMQVERHPFDPKTKTEEVEVGYYQEEKVTATEYAYSILAVGSDA